MMSKSVAFKSPSRLREGLGAGACRESGALGRQAHPQPLPQAGGEQI